MRVSFRPHGEASIFFAMLAGSVLAGIGCVRSLPVPTARLPEMMRLSAGDSVEVDHEGEKIEVHPHDAPRLRVEFDRGCSVLEKTFAPRDCAPVVVPMESASLVGDTLQMSVHTGSLLFGEMTAVSVPVDQIQAISLLYDPADRRPEVGIGLALLGPGRFAGPQVQWLPASWVALELGMGGAADLGAFAWAGTRLRPLGVGPVRPFVGGFVNGAAFALPKDEGGEAGKSGRQLAMGPRFGMDIELSRHYLLSLEFDLVHRSDPASDIPLLIYSETTSTWLSSGGLTFSYLF